MTSMHHPHHHHHHYHHHYQQQNNSKTLQALRNSTIVAMSNLLNANIESGLMRSIALGYHRDAQTRAAFMEVLTQILQQGTEFDTLAETVLADRFERLVDLMTIQVGGSMETTASAGAVNGTGASGTIGVGSSGTSGVGGGVNGGNAAGGGVEFPIAMALANVMSVNSEYMDELARVLVTIFDAKRLLPQLLTQMFTKEVEVADCYQIIFRGNSLASKIMFFCFKIYGANYLVQSFQPILMGLFAPENIFKSYEVRALTNPTTYKR